MYLKWGQSTCGSSFNPKQHDGSWCIIFEKRRSHSSSSSISLFGQSTFQMTILSIRARSVIVICQFASKFCQNVWHQMTAEHTGGCIRGCARFPGSSIDILITHSVAVNRGYEPAIKFTVRWGVLPKKVPENLRQNLWWAWVVWFWNFIGWTVLIGRFSTCTPFCLGFVPFRYPLE